MGRGFLSGIFWGGIVSVALLFVSSQSLERQTLSFPKPEAAEVEVPGGSEFNQARVETDPVIPETDARPGGDAAAGPAMPAGSDAPPALDTAALEVPVPRTTQEAPETLGAAPEASEDVSEPASAADSAVAESAGEPLLQPESPGPAPETGDIDALVAEALEEEEAPVVASEADAAPVEGEAGVAELPAAEDTPVQPGGAAVPRVASQIEAPDVVSPPSTETESALPAATGDSGTAIDQAPEAPELPSIAAEPSLPPVGASDAPDAPEIEIAAASEGEETPLPSLMEEPDDAGAAAGETPVDTPEAPVVAAVEATPGPEVPAGTGDAPARSPADSGDSVLKPVETLTDGNSNLLDERDDDEGEGGSGLPVVRRFGDSSAAPEEDLALLDDAAADAGAAETDTEAARGPALLVNASAFEAPEGGLPMLSIVLVNQGGTALAPEVLDALSPHIAFAVDASMPEAEAIARAYRAAGREVVMIPALPAGAAPQDIEQALTVNFERVPEAVAVMDVSGSSFQSDRDAVAQVVDVVSVTGHGLITFPRGLNTAHQEAQRAGVPTGLIFRNLDGGGESQEQIQRTLDRAAFRARQDEAVILVGTTGSATLSALTEWALGSRAETVAIAPVSAALGG